MTHDTPPKRIWADPPETFDGMDVWRSEPGGKGIPYILASEAEAMVAAALRGAADLADTTFSGSGTDAAMIIRNAILASIPQPASAALDKLIAEAEARGMERAETHIAAIERLAISASIASCTCLAKTPDITLHAADCRYVHLQYIIAQCEDFRATKGATP